MTAGSVARIGARNALGFEFTLPAALPKADLTELLCGVKRRDEAALSRLYDATAAKVYGLARTISGNAADADEVVCDTYLQAWQSASRFDPGRGSVLAWLLMICRSRALDLLRQRRSRACAESAVTCLAQETAGPAPEDLLRQVEEGAAIQRAVGELTPLRRQLLALAFFRGMSHQEIAVAARLPVGTVKSHLRRSLQSLRGVLDSEEV
ncbi:MAG TPA: sigma-70 family RNA polymerase sigma factor [Steroidobacteraceae bacterium]|nr:sigma-70 family RNA polymerase sigma factor [Steroidobacteraceae bacterium]